MDGKLPLKKWKGILQDYDAPPEPYDLVGYGAITSMGSTNIPKYIWWDGLVESIQDFHGPRVSSDGIVELDIYNPDKADKKPNRRKLQYDEDIGTFVDVENPEFGLLLAPYPNRK